MTKRVGPRYAILPADAVTDPALSGPDLKVLALLGRHIDRKGWCTRAQKRMAEELSVARGTLQRSLGRLVDAGYVEVEQVQRRDGGQAANRYRVILDDQARADQLDLFSFVTDAVRDEGEGTPCLTNEPPLPHLERAPPASPRRGTHKERPLYRTSPSEEAALPGARVPANDQPKVDPQPDAVPVAKAPGAVPMSRMDGDALEDCLMEAAGAALDPMAARLGLRMLAEPRGWLDAGCDLHFDVLPIIAGICSRPGVRGIKSWNYFAAAVRQARDRRLAAALPAPLGPTAGRSWPGAPPPSPKRRSFGDLLFDQIHELVGQGDEPQAEADPDPQPTGDIINVAFRRR